MFFRSWSRSLSYLPLPCFVFRIWHFISVIAVYSVPFVFVLAGIACRLSIRCHWLLAVLYSGPASTISPFSTPLINRIKLMAYFLTLGSSQIPISSIIPLSKGEENQWLCIQNDCYPSRWNNCLYAKVIAVMDSSLFDVSVMELRVLSLLLLTPSFPDDFYSPSKSFFRPPLSVEDNTRLRM